MRFIVVPLSYISILGLLALAGMGMAIWLGGAENLRVPHKHAGPLVALISILTHALAIKALSKAKKK